VDLSQAPVTGASSRLTERIEIDETMKVLAAKLLRRLHWPLGIRGECRVLGSLASLLCAGFFVFGMSEKGLGAGDSSDSASTDAWLKERMPFFDMMNHIYAWHSGEVILGQEVARLQVPKGFVFLEERGTRAVTTGLLDLSYSLDLIDGPLGMLYPDAVNRDHPEGWGVVISYEKTTRATAGSVSDADALLHSMQEEAKAANPGRVKDGLKAIQSFRWAVPPQYDAVKHQLFWIIEVHYDADPQTDYFCGVRILGCNGVLRLDAVNTVGRLGLLKEEMPVLMNAIDFLPGNRYTDHEKTFISDSSTSELIKSSINSSVYLFEEREESDQKWNSTVRSWMHHGKAILLIVTGVIALGRFIFRRLEQS
jgi:uncharacterized membrane-anchored protein